MSIQKSKYHLRLVAVAASFPFSILSLNDVLYLNLRLLFPIQKI